MRALKEKPEGYVEPQRRERPPRREGDRGPRGPRRDGAPRNNGDRGPRGPRHEHNND